jgi:hypothetical protein
MSFTMIDRTIYKVLKWTDVSVSAAWSTVVMSECSVCYKPPSNIRKRRHTPYTNCTQDHRAMLRERRKGNPKETCCQLRTPGAWQMTNCSGQHPASLFWELAMLHIIYKQHVKAIKHKNSYTNQGSQSTGIATSVHLRSYMNDIVGEPM